MKANVHGAVGGILVLALALGGCAGGPSATGSARTPTTTEPAPTPIDGTYSVTWTYDDLYAALGGADNPDAAHDAEINMGEVQVTFSSGDYDLEYVDLGDSCPGTFVVEGERVVMTATKDPSEWDCGDGLGQLLADAEWSLDGDELTLTDWQLSPQPAMDWFAHVMLGMKPLTRLN